MTLISIVSSVPSSDRLYFVPIVAPIISNLLLLPALLYTSYLSISSIVLSHCSFIELSLSSYSLLIWKLPSYTVPVSIGSIYWIINKGLLVISSALKPYDVTKFVGSLLSLYKAIPKLSFISPEAIFRNQFVIHTVNIVSAT